MQVISMVGVGLLLIKGHVNIDILLKSFMMVQSFQNHFVKAELSTSCLLISDRHYPTRRGIHYDLRANPTSIVNAYIGGQFNGCGNSIIHSCKLQRGIFSRASNQNRGIRSKLSFNGHKLNQRVGANRKRFLLFA